MSGTLEQTKFLNWARTQEQWMWVVKYPGGIHGTKGTPDTLMCVMGFFLAIEFKSPNEAIMEMQTYQRNRILMSGGRSEICRSAECAKNHCLDLKKKAEEWLATRSKT